MKPNVEIQAYEDNREYKTTDYEQLEQLFYNTVHSVNAKDYTKE